MSASPRLLPALALLLCADAFASLPLIHHELVVRVDPGSGAIRVRDTLRLPPQAQSWTLHLRRSLSPRVSGPGRLAPLGLDGDEARYRLTLPDHTHRVVLDYGGTIGPDVAETAGPWRITGGIGPQGVFLDAVAGWYPRVENSLQAFDMTVHLPAGWLAVSQGRGPDAHNGADGTTVHWREDHPQEDIYLVAARFHFYHRDAGAVQAQVFLREDDPALARRYLDATGKYLSLYSRLLGDYPYAKFALVENRSETGFGMPSFTLLGPRVIRLPFIVHTSYPHEILHNWWGNGVYVDYAGGNWSEGLTTYLADYLLRERRGRGAAYRRETLQRFADYVRAGRDFPLRDFRARHDEASQSVGYGRGMMLFHMLRRELGDDAFFTGLRRFFHEFRFRVAGFDDLEHTLEQTSGRDLGGFFKQWLNRTGAPKLAVEGVRVTRRDNAYLVTGHLRQVQSAPPFRLQVPVVVKDKNGTAVNTSVAMTGRTADFRVESPSPPLRLEVDPGYDLFRTLYPAESPPSLSTVFGAEHGLIVLPSDASPAMGEAYAALAGQWKQALSGWEVQRDRDLRALPANRAVWLLGWSNRFVQRLARGLPGYGATLDQGGLRFGDTRFGRDEYSIALTAPAAGPGAIPIAWLGARDAGAAAGLARKLPHYGRYGITAFRGDAPDNVLKAQWPVRNSPLSVPLHPATGGPLSSRSVPRRRGPAGGISATRLASSARPGSLSLARASGIPGVSPAPAAGRPAPAAAVAGGRVVCDGPAPGSGGPGRGSRHPRRRCVASAGSGPPPH